jgi:chemotaxis protein CheD
VKSLISDPEVELVTVSPGQLFFGGGRTVVQTLLGSCVAITLWHPERRIGGMCHYLLADRGQADRRPARAPGYFAADAIEYLVAQVRASARPRSEFEAKMFGGGNMFEGVQAGSHPINVAQANVRAGRRLLEQYGFSIKAADVGGSRYRKIFFDLDSGDVWVQYGQRHFAAMSGGVT